MIVLLTSASSLISSEYRAVICASCFDGSQSPSRSNSCKAAANRKGSVVGCPDAHRRHELTFVGEPAFFTHKVQFFLEFSHLKCLQSLDLFLPMGNFFLFACLLTVTSLLSRCFLSTHSRCDISWMTMN